MERYDAVVIGAGYAGLGAALQLSGRRVALLERNPSVLEKRRVSLGLLFGLGEPVMVRGDDLYLKELDLFVEGGVKTRLRRLELRGRSESLILDCDRVIVDESRLKGALLRRLLEQKTEVVTNCAVRQISGDGRTLRVRAEADFQAKVVIGADGASSQVARSLDFFRRKNGLLFAREVVVDRLELAADTLLVNFCGSGKVLLALREREHFRALFIEVRGPRDTPSQMQDELEDRLERIGGGRVLKSSHALVHLYRPSGDCCRNGVLLAGDAVAAWGVATIAGALAMGRLAGQIAERMLAASQYALSDYRRQWRRVSGQPLLEWGGRAAQLALRLDPDRADRLIGGLRGPSGHPVSLSNFLLHLPVFIWRTLSK